MMRRVGVLVTLTDDDAEGKARVAAFREALQELGWTNGRNLQILVRWSAGDVERIRKNAAELAALAPDVIVATGNSTIGPLLQATSTAFSYRRFIVPSCIQTTAGALTNLPFRGKVVSTQAGCGR